MTWADAGQLLSAYGLAIGAGLLLGALIALFNSWRV